MILIILLGTAAIAIPFVISICAPASKVGRAVSDRFLERGFSITIPADPEDAEPKEERVAEPKEEKVNATNLRTWVEKHRTQAEAYAWRVMPLDFLYLFALGGFLTLAALALASAAPAVVRDLSPCWWLVLPLAYLVADFLEDCLIIWLMTQSISQLLVNLLAVLRYIKIGSNIGAMLQIFALAGLGLIAK